MASGSWVFDPHTQELIPKSQYVRRSIASTEHARSGLPRPMIISDHLDEMFSHADGKRYTSKSAYYKSVKAHGCEIVGNEDLSKHVAPSYDAKAHEADVVADVRRAIATAGKK